MKISEAFEKFRQIEIRGRGCAPATDMGYHYTCKVVVEYFGDLNIKKLKLGDISSFYLSLIEPSLDEKRQVSRNTASEYVSKLRSVIRFCRKQGIKVINPDDIRIPKPEKKYARFIMADDYERFLAEVSRPRRGYCALNRQRNIVITKMLFFTGLRISELCALNKGQIKDRQFAVVGKSKDPRPCFITKDIENEINKYLNMRSDDNPALFIANETGERIRPGIVRQVFRETSKRIGAERITPHTMRHSFATRMIEEGVDIRYVAAFLGHQSLNTTKRYTHVRDYKMRQIYQNVLENY